MTFYKSGLLLRPQEIFTSLHPEYDFSFDELLRPYLKNYIRSFDIFGQEIWFKVVQYFSNSILFTH